MRAAEMMGSRSNSTFFLCLSGIDGSGKTTLSKALCQEFSNEGFKCKYLYIGFTPMLLKPFMTLGQMIFINRKVKKQKDYKSYLSTKQAAIQQHSVLSTIYQYMLLLDYSVQVIFKANLALLRRESIICDRYYYDVIIYRLATDFQYSNTKMEKILQAFTRMFPKPTSAFFIDTPEEVAFKRKNDIPSIDYLREKRAKYKKIAKRFNLKVLDGTLPLAELKRKIKEDVAK